MFNPYPRYIPDETCPGVEVENPLYVVWDEGYETAKQEAEKERRSWENEGNYARAHGDY